MAELGRLWLWVVLGGRGRPQGLQAPGGWPYAGVRVETSLHPAEQNECEVKGLSEEKLFGQSAEVREMLSEHFSQSGIQYHFYRQFLVGL